LPYELAREAVFFFPFFQTLHEDDAWGSPRSYVFAKIPFCEGLHLPLYFAFFWMFLVCC
jgi:hypothetical protein